MKIIYLPVEIKARELDSKILLALSILNKGYSVVIGQQWALYKNIDKIPTGIFIFKGQNKIHHPVMQKASRYGHKVIAMEEETLAICETDTLVKIIDRALFDITDFVFINGEYEKSFCEKEYKKESKEKLFVSGNPRIDILKKKYRSFYEEKIKKINDQYGNYLLINTNFGAINSYLGGPGEVLRIASDAGIYDLKNKASIEKFENFLHWQTECQKGIFEAVDKLNDNLNSKIIIRPHPGENIQNVIDKYSEFNNVYIIREGSHLPWTLGSKLLIHTSCTTGLEAYIAGMSAISYIPNDNWYSLQNLSNRVCQNIRSVSDLVKIAKDIINEKKAFDNSDVNIDDYIFNASSESAIENIANKIIKIESKDHEDFILDDSNFKILQRHPIHIEKCSFETNSLLNSLDVMKNIEGYNFDIKFKKITDSLYQVWK